MTAVCFYFQIHQPYRIKNFGVFDIGHKESYFDGADEDDLNNGRVLQKVARKSYRPALELLQTLLAKHPEFKISFSVSGTALTQLETYAPDIINLLQTMAQTGQVEFLGETEYHSLAFFNSPAEFNRQVKMHTAHMQRLFGITPKVFRNTELSYNNDLGVWAEKAGYDGIIAEGWDPVLGYRSSNFVYRPVGTKKIRLLLKNYKLSDDIAFRFSSQDWSEWPLSAEKFTSWVHALNGNADILNLFMDFETFGEHQWEETGIFTFLEALPRLVLEHRDTTFMTPSEIIAHFPVRDEVSMPNVVTWADTDRDLTAWNGNAMQREALKGIYALEEPALNSGDPHLIELWRKMQTSDHFYYMCTKWFSDGDVHAYFSPYESPYEAQIQYMNALADLSERLHKKSPVTV
jgi:alpha-amylase